jgi:hypothetical protein
LGCQSPVCIEIQVNKRRIDLLTKIKEAPLFRDASFCLRPPHL